MKQINCLRCRHCQLMPETDFALRRPVIFCGKIQEQREINWRGCPMPNTILHHATNRRHGDKLKHAGAVEKAFLQKWYPVAARETLLKLTGRSHWMTIVHIANRIGLVRGDMPERRHAAAMLGRVNRHARGFGFSLAQAAYIEKCFADGYWATRHFGRQPAKSQSDEIKAAIVTQVNAMDEHGRVWKWESIRSHMKWVSPSYRRETAKRLRAKKRRAKIF